MFWQCDKLLPKILQVIKTLNSMRALTVVVIIIIKHSYHLPKQQSLTIFRTVAPCLLWHVFSPYKPSNFSFDAR